MLLLLLLLLLLQRNVLYEEKKIPKEEEKKTPTKRAPKMKNHLVFSFHYFYHFLSSIIDIHQSIKNKK